MAAKSISTKYLKTRLIGFIANHRSHYGPLDDYISVVMTAHWREWHLVMCSYNGADVMCERRRKTNNTLLFFDHRIKTTLYKTIIMCPSPVLFGDGNLVGKSETLYRYLPKRSNLTAEIVARNATGGSSVRQSACLLNQINYKSTKPILAKRLCNLISPFRTFNQLSFKIRNE